MKENRELGGKASTTGLSMASNSRPMEFQRPRRRIHQRIPNAVEEPALSDDVARCDCEYASISVVRGSSHTFHVSRRPDTDLHKDPEFIAQRVNAADDKDDGSVEIRPGGLSIRSSLSFAARSTILLIYGYCSLP